MAVEIISAESVGVRSLCCAVETGTRRIVIDPGVALGYLRYGLTPHPCELALAARARKRIVAALEQASDVVFSHMHGDHGCYSMPSLINSLLSTCRRRSTPEMLEQGRRRAFPPHATPL